MPDRLHCGHVSFDHFPITTAGVWGFYNTQSTSMLGSNTYNPNNATCPTGNASNSLVYICVILNESGSATTTSAQATPYGALSIALNSVTPPTPDAPTVVPLDSGLSVSWRAVPGAAYYNVIVASATGNASNSSDAGLVNVVQTQVTDTTATCISGLTNGTEFLVFVGALDDSGTNPPTTSNASPLSPPGTGTPSASADQSCPSDDGGASRPVPFQGCTGCSSGEFPGALALLVSAAARRRKKRTPPVD